MRVFHCFSKNCDLALMGDASLIRRTEQCQALVVTNDVNIYIYHSDASVLPLPHDLFAITRFLVQPVVKVKGGWGGGAQPTCSGLAPDVIWAKPDQKLSCPTQMKNHVSWLSKWYVNSVLWTKNWWFLKPKIHQNQLLPGLRKEPHWGILQRSAIPPILALQALALAWDRPIC